MRLPSLKRLHKSVYFTIVLMLSLVLSTVGLYVEEPEEASAAEVVAGGNVYIGTTLSYTFVDLSNSNKGYSWSIPAPYSIDYTTSAGVRANSPGVLPGWSYANQCVKTVDYGTWYKRDCTVTLTYVGGGTSGNTSIETGRTGVVGAYRAHSVSCDSNGSNCSNSFQPPVYFYVGDIYNMTKPVVPSVAPTLTNLTTAPTIGNVLVSMNHSGADLSIRQYRINSGAWLDYTGTITMTDNGSVEGRVGNPEGYSPIAYLDVNNIDRVPPVQPILRPSTAAPTNVNVGVTIDYSADSVSKQYRLNNGAWQDYTAPISIGSNTYIEAKASDLAGNVSTVAYLMVDNIDKVKPTASLTPESTVSTATGVVLNITASDDVSTVLTKTLYFNGYGVPVYDKYTATDNGEYTLEVKDEAGNVTTKKLSIKGVDADIGEAPRYVLSDSAPTVDNVVVAVSYSPKAVEKQYSLNGGAWQEYNKPIQFSSNGVLKARSKEKSGSYSAESSVTVGNIVKMLPTSPRVAIDKTSLTNDGVVVTLTGDSSVQGLQIKLGGGAWVNYSNPVKITENTVVKSRSIGVGNGLSKEKAIKLNNIDITPPEFVLTGIRDKGVYTNLIAPQVKVYDESKTNVTYKVDGKDYFIGVPLEKGSYALEVIVTDMAGNKATENLNFGIR